MTVRREVDSARTQLNAICIVNSGWNRIEIEAPFTFRSQIANTFANNAQSAIRGIGTGAKKRMCESFGDPGIAAGYEIACKRSILPGITKKVNSAFALVFRYSVEWLRSARQEESCFKTAAGVVRARSWYADDWPETRAVLGSYRVPDRRFIVNKIRDDGPLSRVVIERRRD